MQKDLNTKSINDPQHAGHVQSAIYIKDPVVEAIFEAMLSVCNWPEAPFSERRENKGPFTFPPQAMRAQPQCIPHSRLKLGRRMNVS